MGKGEATPAALRKRARDALLTVILSLFFLKVPFVFYVVPFVAFGAAWSAQSADRQLTRMKQKPTWTGAAAVPLGILVGLIGAVFVAASVAETIERIRDAREQKALDRANAAAAREAPAPEPDASIDAP